MLWKDQLKSSNVVPAAGVVGAVRLSKHVTGNLITFDMGGTTAKASIVESGHVSRDL